MESSHSLLPSTGRLRISLLGAMEVHAGATRLQLPTRKAQALLAYLALRPGKLHEREKLQALLWPEVARAQAQGSLRQALLSIRNLPIEGASALLQAQGTCIALRATLVTVDVVDLERCAARDTEESLEDALRLYGGPLLDGLSIPGGELEDWVALERSRLQELSVAAFEKLAELQANAGNIDRAIQTVLRSLRIEPLQERTHRTLMRLYALHGRRAEALQQYATCATWLKRELGVEPEEQTLRLYRELQREREPRREPAATATALKAPLPPKPRLIGREDELERLTRALDAAWAGSAPVVVLRGDAGVGKTRLLEAIASYVAELGGIHMRGRCYESEQVLPFSPWIDLVRDRPEIAERALELLPATMRGELQRSLRIGDEALPAAPGIPIDAHILFEAICELFSRIASHGPLLIVLEDLHWGDATSMRLLSYFARHVEPSSRICVMASMRTEEANAEPLLRTALHEIDRDRRLVELTLEPLTRESAFELIRTLAPALGDDAVLQRVWSMSEGNPLVIVEALREHAPDVMAANVGRLPVPLRIRELIAGYVARLDRPGRDALATAAVIGRAFDFALLARASGSSDEDAAAIVEELVRERMLQASGTTIYFVHDRIREVVLEGLLPMRRQLLHRSIAHALVATCGERTHELSGSIGYHFAAAEDAIDAVRHLLRFARYSSLRLGLDEALLALQEVARLTGALPPDQQPAVLVETATLRALCFLYQGQIAELQPVLTPHSAIAAALDAPALALAFSHMSAFADAMAGDDERAAEHEARALAMLDRFPDIEGAGPALAGLCRGANERGDHRRSIDLGLSAIAKLEGASATHAHAPFARLSLATSYLAIGDWRAALDCARRAADAAERSGVRGALGLSRATEGLVRGFYLGQHAAGLDLCASALQLTSDPYTALPAHMLFVHVCQLAARLPGGLGPEVLNSAFYEAKSTLERLLTMDGFSSSQLAVDPLSVLSRYHLFAGDLERARDYARRAMDLCLVGHPRRARACHAMAQLELEQSRPHEASRLLEQVQRIYALGDTKLDLPFVSLSLASAEHLLGNAQAAASHMIDAHRMFKQFELTYWCGLVPLPR